MDKTRMLALQELFDDVCHYMEDGTEFWYAREI